MKRKRKVHTREVHKRKARLKFDGSKQKKGDYDQTFAPAASWESVRILLAPVPRNSWHAIQLDCALAFPQAPVDRECCMQIPKGIKIDAPGKWALRVHKNICGQKCWMKRSVCLVKLDEEIYLFGETDQFVRNCKHCGAASCGCGIF